MKNIPGSNLPGAKDKWGRPVADCWYGFNPQSKKFEAGPCYGIMGKDFATQCKPKKPGCPSNKQQSSGTNTFQYSKLKLCNPGDQGKLVRQGSLFALSNGTPFCKIISSAQI